MDPQHPQDLPYPATADHPMGPVPIPEDTEHHPMALDHQPPPPGLENTQPLSTPPTNGPGPDAPPYRQHQLFSNQLPPQMPQVRRKPKRSAQPLHLLLQDAGRQYIVNSLAKKTEDEITELFQDKKKLYVDLRTYCTDTVLTSARDRILGELDEQGKEALKDVNPDSEIIKLRFEEFQAVNRSFEDAIADLRYEHGEKADQQQKGQEGGEEKVAMVMEGFPEEIVAIFRLWDQSNRRDAPEGSPASDRPYRNTRPERGNRGGSRGGGPPPPRHSPYQGPPSGYRGGRDFSGYPPRERDYRDRREREDPYYRDRRYDDRRDYDRRPPPPPPPMSDYRGPPPSPMSRNSRERSMERSYHPSPRYDDRRGPPPMRDARYDPREERYPPGPPPSRDHRGPPPGPPQGPPQIGPTMPMKPSQSTYEAPPMPPSQPPPQPQGHDPSYGYGHQYPDPNAQYPHAPYPTDPNAQAQAYYGQYPQDPSVIGMNGYGAPAPVPPQGQYPYTSAPAQQYQGWADPNAQSYLNTLPLQVMSFGSRDMGRHTSVPLPTDFMSGPSDAPRLSMPEPHEVLGVIKGVIIRDAQGNIGLSQYQFTTL